MQRWTLLAVFGDELAARRDEFAGHFHNRLARCLEGDLVLGDRLRFGLCLVVGQHLLDPLFWA